MITDTLPKSCKIIIPDKLRKALQEVQRSDTKITVELSDIGPQHKS